LVVGYFEFARPRKLEFYQTCRNKMAELWLALEFEDERKPEIQDKLINSLIPGVSGLIRKTENGFKKEFRNDVNRE